MQREQLVGNDKPFRVSGFWTSNKHNAPSVLGSYGFRQVLEWGCPLVLCRFSAT
jgi:hypothetical protein